MMSAKILFKSRRQKWLRTRCPTVIQKGTSGKMVVGNRLATQAQYLSWIPGTHGRNRRNRGRKEEGRKKGRRKKEGKKTKLRGQQEHEVSMLRNERWVHPWGLGDSPPSMFSMFQTNESTIRQMVPEEQHPKLISGLYMRIHIFAHVHKYVCIHTHICALHICMYM